MENSKEDIELKNYIEESKKRQFIISIIIYILNSLLDLLTFGLISYLVHLSFKSPFKNHIIGDLNK